MFISQQCQCDVNTCNPDFWEFIIWSRITFYIEYYDAGQPYDFIAIRCMLVAV